jgi:transposase
MPAPLPIRTDHDPAELRRLARRERDGCVSARLLALANALEGIPREEAARLAGMTGQTLGDWVHRYNVEGVEGLRDRPRPGRPCALDEGQQATLKALVLRGPRLERDGCVAWRARDLCALVEERFGVRYGESGMLKLLKGLDLSWQKTRPVHPEADPKAQERFKKPCPARCGRRRTVTPRRRGSSCGSWTRPASARRAA